MSPKYPYRDDETCCKKKRTAERMNFSVNSKVFCLLLQSYMDRLLSSCHLCKTEWVKLCLQYHCHNHCYSVSLKFAILVFKGKHDALQLGSGRSLFSYQLVFLSLNRWYIHVFFKKTPDVTFEVTSQAIPVPLCVQPIIDIMGIPTSVPHCTANHL
jgi:hypothetical protein